jgi:hypothetical protein
MRHSMPRSHTKETLKTVKDLLPKDVVIDLAYESLTALEQKLEASVGTNHQVPTVIQ